MALPELTEAERLFKSVVFDTARDLALAAIFVRFPYLNWFPLNAGIKWLIENYSDKLWECFADLINVTYIPLRNAELQRQFTEVALRLKEIALHSGIDSPEYLEARREHQQKFAERVRSLTVPNP